ncbi:unnamed protein product, partial [Cylindrotheca closterium]
RPVHAEKVAAADVNSDSDSDDSLLEDVSHNFTKVTVKGKTKIKKQPPKSAVAPTLEHDGPVLTPAQQRRAKEAERKRKMDLENNVPSPLFIMVLPGEMEGTYLFISRLKYAALATNVLNGLVPFFTHHLGELTTTQANRVIAKWLSMSLINTTRRKELVWCLETLRARPSDQTLQGIDEAIDFLDEFGSDPLDVAEAKLEFDMEMADAKDIDDGATVAGAMDELLEKDSQLEAAITEIEFKETLLVEKSSALEAERLRSESLANKLAALRLLQQTISSQAAQPAVPPQPAATVPFPQDRSESAASDSVAKEPTLPATPAQAAKSSPLMAPLPSSPPRATTTIANQPPPRDTTAAASRRELVTPDHAARMLSTSDHSNALDPSSGPGSSTPSLASSRVSDNPSDGSPSPVFPIFRHPQHSPPSDRTKGKRRKKKPLASRGASRSTAGP